MRRILASSLLFLAIIAAGSVCKAETDASVPTSARAITTGVTAPRLVYSAPIKIAAGELPVAYNGPAQVVLRFTLDQTGSPQAIEVIHPLTQAIDARVVSAVHKFRWTPAVLNNQTVPIELNLTLDVQR